MWLCFFFREGRNKLHHVHLARLACKAVAFLYKHLVRRMQFCLQEESSGMYRRALCERLSPAVQPVVSRQKLHRGPQWNFSSNQSILVKKGSWENHAFGLFCLSPWFLSRQLLMCDGCGEKSEGQKSLSLLQQDECDWCKCVLHTCSSSIAF